MRIITSLSPRTTFSFGKKLSRLIQSGDILCLRGELGSGKTTLIKGLARGLGIKNQIVSPTFALMNIYRTTNSRIKYLVHIDAYRLKNEMELLEIGAEDYLGRRDFVCAVEWPEKISGLLKNKKIKKIYLEHSIKGRILRY